MFLDGYDWPGNVRELEGSIERACSFSSGPQIFLKDFPSQLMGYRQQLHVETLRVDARVEPRESRVGTALSQAATGVGATGIVSIAELEKQAILAAIHSLNGDKLMAAKLLGIGKTTLYRKLKEYGLWMTNRDAYCTISASQVASVETVGNASTFLTASVFCLICCLLLRGL